MNKKIIKIDLSCFFDDEKKMVLISVNPNWKTIECLQKRLEFLFDINSFWLSCDDCFLHAKEPIEIALCCDVVKACILKESLTIKTKKKSKHPKEIETSKIKIKDSKKSNKPRNVNDEWISSTVTTSDEISKTNNYLEEKQIEVQPTNNLSKKRTVSKSLDESNNDQKVVKYENLNNPFKKQKSKKSHIYFYESSDSLSHKTIKEKKSLTKVSKEPENVVVFCCSLNDVECGNVDQPLKPRKFHLISKSMTTKEKITIQEDILLPPLSIKNGMNDASLTNEATIINNFSDDTNEICNNNLVANYSTISPRCDKKEKDNFEKLIHFKNDTNINVVAIEEVNETLERNDDEPLKESQNLGNIQAEANIENKENYVEKQEELIQIKHESDVNQISNNDTSILSVECVDLSNDLKEEEVHLNVMQQTHDLTADDEITDIEEISEIIDLN